MNKLYKRVRAWLLEQKRAENGFSAFITFLYRSFSSAYTEAIISLVGTIGIGIMTAKSYYEWPFLVVVFVYVLTILLSAWAKCYGRERVSEANSFKRALLGIDVVLRHWAVKMQKCAKTLNNHKNDNNDKIFETDLAAVAFQEAAFVVCQDLHKELTKYCEDEDVYVTVYQKMLDGNDSVCKMIAFSETHEPSTYHNKYPIPIYSQAQYGEIEYHTYLFAINRTDISVLTNPEEVKEAFKIHTMAAERELQIQQYISVPGTPAGQRVSFLLQIDTKIPSFFGEDRESVEKYAKTVVYPYAQFLHMAYEQERTLDYLYEIICDKQYISEARGVCK